MRDTSKGELTYTECFNVLSSFKNNKSPGKDDLSVASYREFWAEIERNLVDSPIHGDLSTTQKEGLMIGSQWG